MNENRRETGARKLPARPDADDLDKAGLDAAENRPGGLRQKRNETPEKTRQSDGTDPPKPRGRRG